MVDRESEDGADHGDGDGVDHLAELGRAREAISEADAHASGAVHEQLGSLSAGIFEEESGEQTGAGAGPKVDRVAEVAQKLDALAVEADGDPEQPAPVAEHIEAARDHLRRYMKAHPQGG